MHSSLVIYLIGFVCNLFLIEIIFTYEASFTFIFFVTPCSTVRHISGVPILRATIYSENVVLAVRSKVIAENKMANAKSGQLKSHWKRSSATDNDYLTICISCSVPFHSVPFHSIPLAFTCCSLLSLLLPLFLLQLPMSFVTSANAAPYFTFFSLSLLFFSSLEGILVLSRKV